MGIFSKFSRKRRGRNSPSDSGGTGGSFVVDEQQTKGMARAAKKLQIGAEDVVIAVMGVTGTGKSTFIKQLVESGVKVGHNLRSCTVDVGIHSFRYNNNQTIHLIDTPGFNDTTRSDTEVLTEIAYFLGGAYSRDVKLAGIIYLHRIIDNRMGGSTLKNLHMFKALCGTTSLSNVVLATTMWDTLQNRETIGRGERIERELREVGDFWGDMVEMGSKMFRHYGNQESALRIVDYIMRLKAAVVLDVQSQMVDEGRNLIETTAGQEVQKELLAAKKKYDEEIKATKESMKAAVEAGNQKMAEKLAKMEAESQIKLDKANKQTAILTDNFAKIQKEGDERMKKMIADLEAQSKQQKEIAADREREMNDLIGIQREHEAELVELKRNNACKDSEWDLKIAQVSADTEREKREIENRRLKRDEAIAAQMKSQQRMSVFKMLAGVTISAAGIWTGNGLALGTGVAILRSS